MQKKIDFAQSIPAQMPPPTASSTGSASKSSVLFNQGGISQEKLMGITCMCEVEKNGFPDLEIRKKDKNKVLHVYRTTKQGERSTLKFALKFQKSGDNALEFYLRDIAGIISSNMANGMMTMILNMRAKDDKGPQPPAIKPNPMLAGQPNRSLLITRNPMNAGGSTMSGQIPSNQPGALAYKLFLSKIEPSLIEGLCKLIKEESGQPKPNGPPQGAVDLSKKRKIGEMSGATQMVNPKQKIRRITQDEEYKGLDQALQAAKIVQANRMNKIRLDHLPWDLIGIIMEYTPRKQVYPVLRGVNVQFSRLIAKRVKGLTIAKPEITQKVLFKVLEKAKLSITQLTLKCRQLQYVSPTVLEQHLIVLPRLQELDLLRFANAINDTTLARLTNACTKSLQSFKIGYGCSTDKLGLGTQSITALSKCRLLKKLQIGDPEDFHKPKQTEGRLANLKRLFNFKQFTLEYITLYQADGYIIDLLTQKGEHTSLLQLCIVHYLQKRVVDEHGNSTSDLEDLLPLKKFTNLQSLNLCSTYFPLQFQVQLPDPENNQQISVAGSRELELMLFSLKNNLRILHLGAYIYDELLSYIAEMCKALEKLEINSEQVTDRGITPLFVKLTQLKYIDLSACPNFTGVALIEAGEHFGAKELRRFVLALQGYEKQKVQERLANVAPSCEVELRMKKAFKAADQ